MERIQSCLVCASPSTGVHNGVVACGGCGAFYRRAVRKKAAYVCFNEDKCLDARQGARDCKACRFRKCTLVGMQLRATRGPLCNSDSMDQVWICPRAGQELEIVFSEAENEKHVRCAESHVVAWPVHKAAFDRVSIAVDLQDSTDQGVVFYPTAPSKDPRIVPAYTSSVREILFDYETALLESAYTHSPPARGTSFSPCAGNVDDRMVSTVQTVGAAVEEVFGDQITCWAARRDLDVNHGLIMHQPVTTFELMATAMNDHNYDHAMRTQKFGAQLPGVSEMDPCALVCTMSGWKYVVFWLIHHAPFMTSSNCYITVGPQQLHCSRYWQDIITDRPLAAFIYQYTPEFREIGLEQIERYLLMAVVMFEPEKNEPSSGQQVLHRLYTDLLLDVIKRRCRDSTELASTCRKLGQFFSNFKVACVIYETHCSRRDTSVRCPRCKLVVCSSQLQSRNVPQHKSLLEC